MQFELTLQLGEERVGIAVLPEAPEVGDVISLNNVGSSWRVKDISFEKVSLPTDGRLTHTGAAFVEFAGPGRII